MKKSLVNALGVVAIAIAAVTVPNALAQSDESAVRVSGADSMFGRIQILTRVFTKNNPAIKVNMIEGQLVDVGIAELIECKADIAMASRSINDKENKLAVQKGVELVERLIGYGGIVIITHPENPLDELSVEQVRKIFKGEYTRWDQLGGRGEMITVVRTDDTHHPGTLVFLEDDFLGGSRFTSDAVALTQFPGVLAKVAKTPGAIGYVRIRDAFESKPKQREAIKILKIKRLPCLVGVTPSRETVSDGAYPIKRPYYLYYKSNASADIKSYADFVVNRGWGSQDL
ncbi:MAG TPA: PstS family phosphate ABC transporter substrate-binding protein [Desulfomonilaceae bacterium]|nr:PstS family phosphate ABC transporter substrate-binding protein [Desulfomonilaceae bacterium]